ncbi:S-adenosyl-L-homocysteine hydrolase [Artemisia annua]|uniref:Adenosylhomocysteinase n=1 Tax=Artemisia annua TaxID=35608 RepID=A0A2U1NJH8_ARTAN|nr:S-adenosyl-L-homocysteine hydrolase [Artemisia annua]
MDLQKQTENGQALKSSFISGPQANDFKISNIHSNGHVQCTFVHMDLQKQTENGQALKSSFISGPQANDFKICSVNFMLHYNRNGFKICSMMNRCHRSNNISQFPKATPNDSKSVSYLNYALRVNLDWFYNLYGCCHSLPDGLMRAIDVMIAGKAAVVCGYGDVGKGCVAAMKQAGARVIVQKLTPYVPFRPPWKVFKSSPWKTLSQNPTSLSPTLENKDIIMVSDMVKMKNNAILCNIGHFDNEIDMLGLETYQGVQRITIKPQTDSFVMSCSFTNQLIAQLELWNERNSGKYKKEEYVLPKRLDEKVVALHLGKLGAKLTKLSKDQADYISVPIEGPYKASSL